MAVVISGFMNYLLSYLIMNVMINLLHYLNTHESDSNVKCTCVLNVVVSELMSLLLLCVSYCYLTCLRILVV